MLSTKAPLQYLKLVCDVDGNFNSGANTVPATLDKSVAWSITNKRLLWRAVIAEKQEETSFMQLVTDLYKVMRDGARYEKKYISSSLNVLFKVLTAYLHLL